MLTRREQLEIWRRTTGRTPLKAFSYVQECCVDGKVLKPGRCKSASGVRSRSTVTLASDPKKPPADTHVQLEKSRHASAVLNTCMVRETLSTPAKSRMGGNNKPPRREMLEAWLKTHGSTVKKPCGQLTRHKSHRMHRRTRSATGNMQAERPRQTTTDEDEAVTMMGFEDSFVNASAVDPSTATTVASATCCTCTCTAPTDSTTRTPKHFRRRTVHFVQEDLMFESTTIRFSRLLSEKRKRYSVMARTGATAAHTATATTTTTTTPPPAPTLLHINGSSSEAITPPHNQLKGKNDGAAAMIYVTPVRRSTRRHCGEAPGVALDGRLCFDSPSEAAACCCTCANVGRWGQGGAAIATAGAGEGGTVMVIPNKALAAYQDQ